MALNHHHNKTPQPPRHHHIPTKKKKKNQIQSNQKHPNQTTRSKIKHTSETPKEILDPICTA